MYSSFVIFLTVGDTFGSILLDFTLNFLWSLEVEENRTLSFEPSILPFPEAVFLFCFPPEGVLTTYLPGDLYSIGLACPFW